MGGVEDEVEVAKRKGAFVSITPSSSWTRHIQATPGEVTRQEDTLSTPDK